MVRRRPAIDANVHATVVNVRSGLRRDGTGRWLRALALAGSVHGVALLLGYRAFGNGAGAAIHPVATILLGGADDPQLERTLVDLRSIDTIDPWLGGVLPTAPKSLVETDRATTAAGLGALAAGQPAPVRELAPDMGQGAGRVLPPAWRRDLSTLRARVADGAHLYQPSRERRAHFSASPQDARLEPITGISDSVRTERPRPTLPIAAVPNPSAGDQERNPVLRATEAVVGTGQDESRAQGSLDTQPGAKSFDTPFEGAARDQQKLRAASDESRPVGAEFTAAASEGSTDTTGRGLGTRPGATPQPSGGVSTTRPGAGGVLGTESTADTIERKYAREYQQIRLRVARAIVFPKQPALLLLQGEAIVLFRVSKDGLLDGNVRLVKSAGHDDYDREAVDAVRRALPFPHMPEAQWVRLRIPFLPAAIR